jgi:hypothetical protein
LIAEARAAEIPFRLVVADCIYGENPTLEGRLGAAKIPYVLAIRPSHGTWQLVEDEANPPAFTPHDAALRVPLDQWQRTVRLDSHGKEVVRYVAQLALPPSYGPDRPVRLIAASKDPATLTAGVDLVPDHQHPARRGPCRGGVCTLPPARLDRAVLQGGQA